MKKLIVVFLLIVGFGQKSQAQTDYSLISKFLNSVVNQDVNAMMEVLHSDCYGDIDKLLAQSENLKFHKWEMVGSHGNSPVSYIVAMKVGDEVQYTENLPDEVRMLYISPSGHCFLYEAFYVISENGRKYIRTNADMLSMTHAEQLLRRSGKTIPSKYYEYYGESR
jgi:hypothetical protein